MNIILPMITGGLIGYFTNWLAIKMLFRPFEEKYFLGVKIPFTPGLIPKERHRIAKNIGLTVEEYLLSPEAIIKSLEENDIREKTKNFIDDKLKKIEEKNYKIEDIVMEIPEFKRKNMIFKLRQNSGEFIVRKIRDMNLSKYLREYLEGEIKKEENIERIKVYILDNYFAFLNRSETSMEIERRLSGFLENITGDERYLREIVSPKLVADINNYIDENYKVLGFKAREIIKDENIREKIKDSIRKIVEKNVSPLVLNFIPMEVIGEKGYLAIENYIESHSFSEDLKSILKLLVENLGDKKVKDLAKNLVETIDREKITAYILGILKSQKIEAEIEGLISRGLAGINRQDLYGRLEEKINRILASGEFKLEVENFTDRLLLRTKDIKISQIINSLYIDSEVIYSLGEILFENYLKEDLDKFIRGLKLSKIVETTILEFDNEFTEKLILDIASKELRSITILGGILGMIIGVINPLIQSIL